MDIQQETGVALIFVTHNLGIVAKMRPPAVMYAGRIVEMGAVRDLFSALSIPTPRRCRLHGQAPGAGRCLPFRPTSRSGAPAVLRLSSALRRRDAALCDARPRGCRMRPELDGPMLAPAARGGGGA
jgi:hypothetical protein